MKIEKSERTLKDAVAIRFALMLRQCPLVMKGFQIISRGMQAKASTKVSMQ